MVPQNFFVWNTSCNISNNINHNKLKNSNNEIILVYIVQEIHNCDAVSLLIFFLIIYLGVKLGQQLIQQKI